MQKKIIIEQLMPLFMERGYWSVGVDDVAEHLKISKKTLYKYYRSKKDIIYDVLQYRVDYMRGVTQNCEKQSANAIEQFIRCSVAMESIEDSFQKRKNYLELKKYYPEIFDQVIKDSYILLYHLFLQIMLRGQEEGLFTPINPQIAAGILAGNYVNTITGNTMYDITDEVEYREMIYISMLFYLRGMQNDEGRAAAEKIRPQIPAILVEYQNTYRNAYHQEFFMNGEE
ncbi:MAG: TetR/AcrR family transcriptional regulator [Flavobacteriaceae bacterium]|nr:TetR/AcrR family transcriptional regulator [Flavobacteriaceae bacterium]